MKVKHANYQEFKSKLAPVLERIDIEVGKISGASNTFIPPHTFLLRALELKKEGRKRGLLGIKYFGHGIHESLI